MDKNKKVLLPLIRKVYPNMIASQLLGVQPMTPNTASIFGVRIVYQIKFKTVALWFKVLKLIKVFK